MLTYIDKFEAIVGHIRRDIPNLPNDYYISSFVAGLKDYIQYHLQCHNTSTLAEAYWIAKRLEQSYPAAKKFTPFIPATKSVKTWPNTDKQEKAATEPTIQELREQGKCFKWKEPWVAGHYKVCKGKKSFSLLVVNKEDGCETYQVIDEDSEEESMEPTLKVSMHAMQGLPPVAHTFTLIAQIGDTMATALIDSGSDVSFINSKYAIKAKCKISDTSIAKVAATNGETMLSTTACKGCKYVIQGQDFVNDFRLIDVQGYDIILGADWIYIYSPIVWTCKLGSSALPNMEYKRLHLLMKPCQPRIA